MNDIRDRFPELPDGAAALLRGLAAASQIADDLSISEFSDRHRKVSSSSGSPWPGDFRTDRVPYLREPQDCLHPDHPARRVTARWAAQLGKSTAIENWFCYIVDRAPGSMMIVLPTLEEALKFNRIKLQPTIDESPRIGHLGPGETLEFHSAKTPGDNYLPFSQNMQREIARRLGVTFESLSMDHSKASYSSVRMGIASIWPIAMRRRERIAAPVAQGIYEPWLDEMVASGRIPFKGGYRAFSASRDKVMWAEWQGPAKPSADDYKSAMAAKVRMETGVSSLADECAEYGRDWEETASQREREIRVLAAKGLPNPFERMTGGGGPLGAAADGNREPAA